ncbi:MAG: hypothetical protein HFK07_04745 [Clostridia bacterium]|jgi:hypothetical protein|nr:hypothetical protein [Clostridia bacterium]
MKKSIPILLIIVISIVCLAGCVPEIKDYNIDAPDLSIGATFRDDSGIDLGSFKLKRNNGAKGYVDVTFPSPKVINTVVLREQGYNISDFAIYNISNGKEELLYRQDGIDGMRYCVFDTVSVSKLRVKVLASYGGYNLNGISIYEAPKEERDFSVTTYLHIDRFLNLEDYDRDFGIESFSSITDVILFDAATLRVDGTLDVNPNIAVAVRNLREVEKRLQKKFTIYACILNGKYNGDPDNWNNDMNLKSAHYAKAMRDNSEKLIDEINTLIDRMGINGAAFDWEYILKNEYWNVFADFLIALDDAIGEENKISIALSDWSNKLPERAFDAVDSVEIMAYDLFDSRKNHSNFYDCTYKAVTEFVDRGFPIEKLNLGLPFYARETEGGEALWFEYRLEAEKLGYFGNSSDYVEYGNGQIYAFTHYYNGAQMIRDKTAWAYDYGLKGVMVWNHTCDTRYDLTEKSTGKPLSLFRAISDAIASRKK